MKVVRKYTYRFALEGYTVRPVVSAGPRLSRHYGST